MRRALPDHPALELVGTSRASATAEPAGAFSRPVAAHGGRVLPGDAERMLAVARLGLGP